MSRPMSGNGAKKSSREIKAAEKLTSADLVPCVKPGPCPCHEGCAWERRLRSLGYDLPPRPELAQEART